MAFVEKVQVNYYIQFRVSPVLGRAKTNKTFVTFVNICFLLFLLICTSEQIRLRLMLI